MTFALTCSRGLAVALATVAISTMTAAAPTNAAPGPQYLPLTNPAFNQADLGPTARYVNVAVGNSFITGWTVTTGTVDLESAAWAKTGSPSQAVTLNGSSQGGISQALPTTPGRRTTVTFRFGTETWDGCEINKDLRFTVSGTGADSEKVLNPGRPDKSNPHWKTGTYTFTAEDRISHLRFDSLVEGHCGAVITDVTAAG
ncbi:DUF642 domain-containing protein [Streptomyces sp. NPDC048442]|uniref:DUF642 domain-containing protein n=1 Tax=Streptomyces sp. NPDC048442 TaxID=3154823 RepID=UPI0034172D91